MDTILQEGFSAGGTGAVGRCLRTEQLRRSVAARRSILPRSDLLIQPHPLYFGNAREPIGVLKHGRRGAARSDALVHKCELSANRSSCCSVRVRAVRQDESHQMIWTVSGEL
jgi:hypothetical protein